MSETAHWIRLGTTGEGFEASTARPLLLSAEAAGIDWPSSCRNGTCRTCMQRLRAGEVSYRIEWPGLLAEEKAAGWILPCVAHPESDLVVTSPWDEDAPERSPG